MSEQLLTALDSMDKLNSWVRSESFREGFSGGSLRRHIYELKRRAIQDADRRLDCKHRRIAILATCRDCSGRGRYTDWSGHEWPHCRACGSTGTVRLSFVETRVEDRFTWHSPLISFPLSAAGLPTETPELNWTVNQPGRDMTPEEAAHALLLCDDYWRPERWQMECRCGLYEEICYVHYPLYLGRATDTCAHCGGEPKDNLCCHAGFAEYTVGICAACRERLTTQQQFAVVIPQALLTPHVAEWVRLQERTPRRKERAA